MEESVVGRLKQNELEFQNRKYGKIPLSPEHHRKTAAEYEASFLKPLHEGGNKKGELARRTINGLLKHGVEGKRVLDYACGMGDLSIYLSSKGAVVSGFDISSKAIEIAQVKAEVNGLDIDFQVMDASALSFPDKTFDFIVGLEALHHVIILPNVPQELKRVLKDDGEIVFGENWGYDNPLFQLWRERTTLRRNNSADRGEVILGQSWLERYIYQTFTQVEVEPFSLLYLGKKYISSAAVLKKLHQVDAILLGRLSFLGKYCGEAIIRLRK